MTIGGGFDSSSMQTSLTYTGKESLTINVSTGSSYTFTATDSLMLSYLANAFIDRTASDTYKSELSDAQADLDGTIAAAAGESGYEKSDLYGAAILGMAQNFLPDVINVQGSNISIMSDTQNIMSALGSMVNGLQTDLNGILSASMNLSNNTSPPDPTDSKYWGEDTENRVPSGKTSLEDGGGKYYWGGNGGGTKIYVTTHTQIFNSANFMQDLSSWCSANITGYFSQQALQSFSVDQTKSEQEYFTSLSNTAFAPYLASMIGQFVYQGASPPNGFATFVPTPQGDFNNHSLDGAVPVDHSHDYIAAQGMGANFYFNTAFEPSHQSIGVAQDPATHLAAGQLGYYTVIPAPVSATNAVKDLYNTIQTLTATPFSITIGETTYPSSGTYKGLLAFLSDNSADGPWKEAPPLSDANKKTILDALKEGSTSIIATINNGTGGTGGVGGAWDTFNETRVLTYLHMLGQAPTSATVLSQTPSQDLSTIQGNINQSFQTVTSMSTSLQTKLNFTLQTFNQYFESMQKLMNALADFNKNIIRKLGS